MYTFMNNVEGTPKWMVLIKLKIVFCTIPIIFLYFSLIVLYEKVTQQSERESQPRRRR